MSVEAGLQFVDSNLLVYAHDRSAGAKHERARALMQDLWESGNGCLSIQVLQEFHVIVTRKVPLPLNGQTAAQIISNLSTWRVHAPGVEDVLGAIEIHQKHGIAFWDAMILRSAAQLRCRVVWSEDLSVGEEYEGVRVVNPFSGV